MMKDSPTGSFPIKPKGVGLTWTRSLVLGGALLVMGLMFGGAAWFHARYDEAREQTVPLITFSNAEYPEDPEDRSRAFGNYPHRNLQIHQTGDTRYRFVLQPASSHAATIEVSEVDLAYVVAAVPPWVRTDRDLTKVGLIDREWNRQQVQFRRDSTHVTVHQGGDGFEQRALSRVDLARNCLNAGLWEMLLFTVEDGEERVYEHTWFTFPLGLYKQLFERVNGLSYWDYWWSLEHWVDPASTPIRLDRLRTVEREWSLTTNAEWDEAPQWQGEQRAKRKNVLAPPAVHTYRDWYTQPVQFASFIQPGRYSVAYPRDTKLHSLSAFTRTTVRRIRMPANSSVLYELEFGFKDSRTGKSTRLIFGGLDLRSLPITTPNHYERGWQAPMGIGNPSFFETYEELQARPPLKRFFYGFHLDDQNRWMN